MKDNEGATSNKPQRNGGPGKLRGAKDGVPFGKAGQAGNDRTQKQPSKEAKKNGWLKKKKGLELVQAVFELSFIGMKDSQLKKAAAEYFGLPQKEISAEMMLVFRQVEKAIQKADTHAFNAVMDRAYGKPKQPLTGAGDTPLFQPTETLLIIENPHVKRSQE